MAFCNKVGSLVRRCVSTNNALHAQVQMPSMFDAVRGMSTKLFIGGLSYRTDELTLKNAFSQYGEVLEAIVVTDRDSGKPRGIGFVNFADAESANDAISQMDGKELDGRNIRVSLARERSGHGGFGRDTDGY